MNQKVLVLDFGGQYKELIARRVRELNVLSIVKPGGISAEEIKKIAPIGIILTGGPNSVYGGNAPECDKEIFNLNIPVLGICYGHQLMCYMLGGKVKSCNVSEYGKIDVTLNNECLLFEGLTGEQSVLMSHTDYVCELPQGFVKTGYSNDCPIVAMENSAKKLYGVQFHPEVETTKHGKRILKNFLVKICHAKRDYSMDDFIEEKIKEIKEQVKSEKVILGLSGGVDSSVCAALLSKAIPGQLVCIFVDHGFMRKNEGDEIERAFKDKEVKFVRINAEQRFLEKVKGVTDPETKRKIIGKEFVSVFEEEAKKFGDAKLLAQGTIYPDVIESGADNTANIKSHHNVGGLPKDMLFTGLVEPLRTLFKDEVRKIGARLGLPDYLVNRQPFPGPGLAVRCIGELTKEKLDILREADAIFRAEMEKHKVKANQYFAVLTNLRSVGVMGDFRTYDYTVALRAVKTTDFMTAEYVKIPHYVLETVSSRIANEVKGVSRIVYDITGKPPATIEWE